MAKGWGEWGAEARPVPGLCCREGRGLTSICIIGKDYYQPRVLKLGLIHPPRVYQGTSGMSRSPRWVYDCLEGGAALPLMT